MQFQTLIIPLLINEQQLFLMHGNMMECIVFAHNEVVFTRRQVMQLESAKKSHSNDSGLQGFELRGKVERVWTNNTEEKEERRRHLIEAYKIITGKESIHLERFFELSPSKVTWGHKYKLFKKRTGTLGQKFFSARLME